jgi:acetolactate synthase-1/3 small subunit
MEDKTFYTLLVYSENLAGILNQITAVFTRRQVNIESLNVSASSIPGVHKYTITAWSNADQIAKITKQIEKKIDVIKASCYTDDQLFIREVALYKLSTPIVLENPVVTRIIRQAGGSIMEVNPTYITVMLGGITEDITQLFRELDKHQCVLQYTRSGRVAVTRSTVEQVTDFLEKQERKHRDGE